MSKYLNFDNGKYYFYLRMMLNLFLDLRNTNFDDEQTLNFKCFTVNKLALDTNLTLTTVKSSVF